MKIRIFALAKELGLDSKDLIQHCTDAGLDVKNSPLASISEAERDQLLGHMKSLDSKSSGHTQPAPETDRKAPVREEAQTREIRDLGPLASQMKTRRPPRKTSANEPDELTEESVAAAGTSAEDHGELAAEETAQPHDITAETKAAETASVETPAPEESAAVEESEAETGTDAAKETVAEDLEVAKPEQSSEATSTAPEPQEPAVVDETIPEPAPVAETDTESAESGDDVTPAPEDATPSSEEKEQPSPVVAEAKPDTPPAPQRPAMSREDYISPGGSGGATIREMKPVGSVRENRPTKKDKKKAPALPTLAAPSFKPKAPKKVDEGPVQKPDLAITGAVLKNNKLKKLIDKSRDETRRKGEEETGRRTSASGVGLEESRAQRRNRRQTRGGEEEVVPQRSTSRSFKRSKKSGPIERKSSATVTAPITVRSLSEAMGRPAKDLLTVLFKQGTMLNINDSLEDDVALEIALELGVDLSIEHEADFEDALLDRIEREDEDFNVTLIPRPPIVTVLGHVDHGKTTLVDRIRSANVVATEAGGITQHIAAYQVTKEDKKITFVDTPGHAAFGEMRARGANVTDIIVLVVAADDGVMPQTIECISHARAAGVPIIVAMNKCDLPDINEQRVLTDLSQHNVLPSEWGGDVEVVRVSALTGKGVDDLLETILLTAELHEYQTVADIPAEGVCLEAFRDEGRGSLAWGIVRRGTLRVGDVILCGAAYGRVRAMYNDQDEEIREAGPSTPVRIAGFNTVPGAGERFFVMEDVDSAREAAEQRESRGRAAVLAGRGGPVSLEEFFATKDGAVKDLPLILKADTPGSIEAIRSELDKFEHDEVRIKILHANVGGVNESDVYLAASSGAIIIAFHVIAEDRAESLASQEGVEIRRYKIIYNVIDDIRSALEGLLSPEKMEIMTGRALVLRTFSIAKTGTVAGCRVLNGTIERSNRVHVIRDQTIINSYPIASLKREKDDAKEVREGFECGMRLDGFNDVKEGDLLEAYRIEERKRTLDE